MKATHIYLKNFMGIRELNIEPRKITNITGANGAGKSSVITALKTLLKTKSDPELIRKGTDSAEVVMQLDDGMELRRVYKQNKTELTISKNGMLISKPQTWLEEFYNAVTNNPIDFIEAKPKDRLQLLLKSMPLDVDKDYVQGFTTEPVEWNDDAITVIEEVRKYLYNIRRDINVRMKEKESAIAQLTKTIEVLEIPDDIDVHINTLKEKQESIKSQIDKKIVDIRASYADEIMTREAEFQNTINKLRAENAMLRSQFEAEAARQIEEYEDKYRKEYADANEQIKVLEEKARQKAAIQNTLNIIDLYTKEANTLKEQHTTFNKQMEELDDYKTKILDTLPINGLRIQDGELYFDIDGNLITFDKLNTSKQIELAVKIATLQSGELKFICLDGAERLDKFTLDELQKYIDTTDYQIIITTVSNEPLKVETTDKVEPAGIF